MGGGSRDAEWTGTSPEQETTVSGITMVNITRFDSIIVVIYRRAFTSMYVKY